MQVAATRFSTVTECYTNNHFIIGTRCYQITHETYAFSFTNFLRSHFENFDGAVLSIIPEKKSFTRPTTSYNNLGPPLERRNSTGIVHGMVHFYRKWKNFPTTSPGCSKHSDVSNPSFDSFSLPLQSQTFAYHQWYLQLSPFA